MLQTVRQPETLRYSNCVAVSKRIRWDIDKDVFKGRTFDFGKKFLPDGLSLVQELEFMTENEKRLLSQIQGRTYANILGLSERFICAKIIELSASYLFDDQLALEAMIRFSDEEIKHQEMFRRVDAMIGEKMRQGYQFATRPNTLAAIVLEKSNWAVLGLICHMELLTQAHYKQSMEPDEQLSELYKDIFLFHWKEESLHAILDELEWIRENNRLIHSERNHAVKELIELFGTLDRILMVQSGLDTHYFLDICDSRYNDRQLQEITNKILDAYRWQFIISGFREPRFQQILGAMIETQQRNEIEAALERLTVKNNTL